MAKIHVLSGSSGNTYTVVVHIAVPAGNNSAGVLWSDAVKSQRSFMPDDGSAQQVRGSRMIEGTSPGQITTAENNAIKNGTILEGEFQWQDTPGWTNAQRQSDLDIRATQLTDELFANVSRDLKFYGFTRV